MIAAAFGTYLFFVVFVAAVARAQANTNCSGILPENFPGIVAHGIHSLDVNTLRVFKSDVTEDNGIPVVNLDLNAASPILHDAPLLPESPFHTSGLKVADTVLSHMDDPRYDIREYSTLERLIHALHMKEVWQMALMKYKAYQTTPPSSEVCQCATSIEENGVMEILKLIALKVREPELMYGKHATINGKTFAWDGNLYKYSFKRQLRVETTDEPFPKLISEAAWKVWKDGMLTMKDSDDDTLALYLYCALNK